MAGVRLFGPYDEYDLWQTFFDPGLVREGICTVAVPSFRASRLSGYNYRTERPK